MLALMPSRFPSHTAQCVLTIDQVLWAQGVTEALQGTATGNASALSAFKQRNERQLAILVDLVGAASPLPPTPSRARCTTRLSRPGT